MDWTRGFCARNVSPAFHWLLALLGEFAGTYLVAVGTEAKVANDLTGVLGATEGQGVAAGGGAEGELVQGDGLAAGGQDAGAGSGGESQGSDGHLGEGEQAVVIGDGGHGDDDALLALGVDVGNNAGQRDGGAVDLGRKQASQDDLVEAGVGTTCAKRGKKFPLAMLRGRGKIISRTSRVSGSSGPPEKTRTG